MEPGVRINYTPALSEGDKGRLAVCVKPIYGTWPDVVSLVEFFEFYRLLGADHFVLYNATDEQNVAKVLAHYQRHEGLMTVVKWGLERVGLRSGTNIRTQALFTALNDCALRIRGRFGLGAAVDLDEFIIPQEDGTLQVQKLSRDIKARV